MTIASQIITDAYRQSNLLALGTSPTTEQQTEALRYLNRIVISTLGYEAGEQLQDFPLGLDNYKRPAGYPDVPDADWFVPENTRLILNLQNPTTVYLHPKPDDGSRLVIIDADNSLATNPLTLLGNGRTIEGGLSLTLNTNGMRREWLYRSDLGNWNRVTSLTLSDEMPFPERFDDMFITMLAMRLNPAYGVSMDEQAMFHFNRSRSQFRARYKNTSEVGSESGLIRMPKMVADRYEYYDGNDGSTAFDRGIPR